MLPPCLREAASAKAGLKIRHATTHPASVRRRYFANEDTASWWGKNASREVGSTTGPSELRRHVRNHRSFLHEGTCHHRRGRERRTVHPGNEETVLSLGQPADPRSYPRQI